ncbi:hypothetical protein J6590_001698 [Homalodisca vitripennis]|nr:hypothetical protein J6590_001698 [Homalodisca vitripennis]
MLRISGSGFSRGRGRRNTLDRDVKLGPINTIQQLETGSLVVLGVQWYQAFSTQNIPYAMFALIMLFVG